MTYSKLTIDEQFTNDTAGLLRRFTEELTGAEVHDRLNKTGIITGATNVILTTEDKPDICVTIDFSGTTRKFCILQALWAKYLTVDATLATKVYNYTPELDRATEALKSRCEARVAESVADAAQAFADKKEEEKIKRAELRDARRQENFLRKLENLEPVNQSNELFVALGWLAKNVATITASIPDTAESWFRQNFGDAPARIVDSKKKTSGGYPMQWAPGFKLRAKSVDYAPGMIYGCFDANRNLCDTELIYSMVSQYGFSFGKQQDFDKIQNCIPSCYLADFERGCELARTAD